MIKKVFLGITILLTANMVSGQKTENKIIEFPMNEKHWVALSENVEFLNYKSVPAVKSTNKNGFNIMLKDFEFSDGTIEFDVEFRGSGFPGIDFRVDKDTLNSEKFYIRYFGTPNDLRRTTLQYAAVLDGVNMWDVTDDYQAAATIYEEKWNHVKLVIHGKQMKIYVNDMQHARLHVPALEGITKMGGITLNGNVIYANFKVSPNAVEGLNSNEGYDPTYNDSRYLRNWSTTEPVDFPLGGDVMKNAQRGPIVIDPLLLDSTAVWNQLKAERRGLINLTRLFGATEQGERRMTWIKTTISSEMNQLKTVDMGFSDEIWVFINDQLLHMDKNYYGTPSMKEPRGRCTIENTSFQLPLQKGENEILIGVTNYFFGWGIIARLENTDGLKFN